ncbi:MAG TPA: glycoside hydrolase family 3 C-terminal domain-containing protein [Candidatus Acidoferrum sp.]|nr:glycoside hydrolase family 3 C-terminal domain-containing protein [Candidatus Acidoferrum sp.]
MKTRILAALLATSCLLSCQKPAAPAATTPPYQDASLPMDQRVDDLLKRLTKEQKSRLIMGTGMRGNDFTNKTSKVPGAAGYTYAVPELGVSALVLADGPAGLRILPTRDGTTDTFYATAFPIATALASTWDPAVLDAVGKAMGTEVKEYGVDLHLAPGMNIHRNPLGGRNFEYYSEDPLLSGKMAASIVRGVQSQGVGSTIKHFVANNEETNRLSLDTVVSERTLREIYLRGFEIAVREGKPAAVMSSYNKINGTYVSQNKPLLTTVLHDEWHFTGLVMSDWLAGDDPVQQLKAGNNLIMPGTPPFAKRVDEAVASGELDEATLDANLKPILGFLLRSPGYNKYAYSNKPDLAANAKVARQAAAQGVVLLRNQNGALPLSATIKHVALLGNTSYDFISGGTGSGDVNKAYTISLEQALETNGYQIDQALMTAYKNAIADGKAKRPPPRSLFEHVPPLPEMQVAKTELQRAAKNNDVGLVTLGRVSGEGQDRDVQGDFYLTAAELQLLRDASAVFHAAGKKLVVVLNIGNVIETASWRDLADAIVLPWQGGQEAGNALLDVLNGTVNPSGKLPTSFPKRYEDVPSAKSFPGEELTTTETTDTTGFSRGKASRVSYPEGIFVGYRYYDSFKLEPSYPFGFGLSYTQFGYGAATLDKPAFDGNVTISVTVTNTGAVAGREVAQLYLSAPGGGLDKPAHELKAFARSNELKPGEQQTLTFTLQAHDLASFDTARRAWIAAPGAYHIGIGASSRDIRSQADFTLASEIVVETVKAELTPQTALLELKP